MKLWSIRRPAARPRDYGLLAPISTTGRLEAHRLCEQLRAAGIRATCGDAGRPDDRTHLHVLVFPEDIDRARAALGIRS